MVEMSVAGIALDAASRTPIVLLRDPSGRRQVPIWIDQAQAHNIMAGLQGTESPRPLSHDLMAALLEAGGLELRRVIVHAIEDSTFHALLKLQEITEERETDGDEPGSEADQELIEVDARPSDAIALAVRTGSSIWMLEEVVAEASIPVDAEADAEDQSAFSRFVDDLSPAALVRHLRHQGTHEPGAKEANDDEPSTDDP
ncbi:bifunctional nuclease family protein [Synechococcus sp. CC9616]|uniref:bifunctional nuclease family protein n=1 Tax=Synechococcus sp. CC9616 TaxID=110663 RepID=UPI00048ED465|nr:bifunctional nuclease family protein [Synechococcus sp. CC9616]